MAIVKPHNQLHNPADPVARRWLVRLRRDSDAAAVFFSSLRTMTAVVAVIVLSAVVMANDSLVVIETNTTGGNDASKKIAGRVLVEAQDGSLLLEQRNGRIITLTAGVVVSRESAGEPYSRLAADALSAELLSELGAGFAIRQTDHYVICSDASARYTVYCGQLLERVHEQFYAFFEDSETAVRALDGKLPVVIFGRRAAFDEYAGRQHPETDLSDTPGYYSVRDNQMIIAALSGDRSFRTNSDVLRELRRKPRQVETIVHESVHQLMFNSGAQVRYAANPLWLSEGLAVYFEPSSLRSPLLWRGPGAASKIHLTGFRAASRGGQLRLPFPQLLTSDTAFQSADQQADAYAVSWALTHYLVHKQRPAFDRLLSAWQQKRPRQPVSAEERLRLVTDATGQTTTELQENVMRHLARLRTR